MVEVIHLIPVLVLLCVVLDNRRRMVLLVLLFSLSLMQPFYQEQGPVLDWLLIHCIRIPDPLSECNQSNRLSQLLQLHLDDSPLQVLLLSLLILFQNPHTLWLSPCLDLVIQPLKQENWVFLGFGKQWLQDLELVIDFVERRIRSCWLQLLELSDVILCQEELVVEEVTSELLTLLHLAEESCIWLVLVWVSINVIFIH